MGIIEQLQQQVSDLADRIQRLESEKQRSTTRPETGYCCLAKLQRKHGLSRYMASQVFRRGLHSGRIRTVVHLTSKGTTVQLIEAKSFADYLANPA